MRIVFLLARYGRHVIGGAETLAKGLARQAQASGWDVEVWTTCATDYAAWSNVLPEGSAVEDGICVRRFAVDPWDPAEYHQLNRERQRRYVLPVQQQYEWLASGPHSSGLVEYTANNAGKVDAVVMMPYLHSVSYDAAWVAGERLVLWPCLHDEHFAYIEPFRLLFESAWGVVFISPEEADLALRGLRLRVGQSAVIGSGVDLAVQPTAVASGKENSPYLLYVGRLDGGKNVPLLYEYVQRYVAEGGNLRLVVVGDGPSEPPQGTAFDVRGWVDEEAKGQLMAGAMALVQPSYNESFSLVMMESWLAGRPVLVWSDCAVTRGHVERSGGGLWFNSYNSFKEAVECLLENADEARKMGENGRDYVLANYRWPQVFERFADTLKLWQEKDHS